VTAIPVGLLAQIAAPASRRAYVQAHWGSRLKVSLHTVDIVIGGLRLPGIEVISDKRGQEIILGRDVLNKLWLGLDGPQRQTEVAEKNPKRKR
jgi:predicted aspartyl protease